MSDTLQSKMQSSKILREKLTFWDAKNDPKAPLNDKQKDSFMELTTQSSNRPLPVELPLDDVPVFRTRHSSVNIGPGEEEEFVRQLEEEKITNSQQFFTWFSEVEEQMQHQEGQPQRKMTSELQTCRCECDQVIEEVTQALDHLETLKVKYVQVATKTNALHEACENLLEEQTKLVNIAESINSKLSYFNELDRISSKLGVPTLNVNSESFVPMLTRLDECIAYLNNNPQYKESSNYLAKFHQCLSRGTALIKLHVITMLQNATQQVLPKKPDKVYETDDKDFPAPSDDAFTLFYGKFRTNAPRIKSLMDQVESRLDKSPEYEQLLVDCHQCYFQQRMALLSPSVSGAVVDLAKKYIRDHCALVRSGCAFMVHVCEDEHQLFFNFFSKPTDLLDSTLEQLCTSLYDVLRPLIIHINHLETLAELCSILKIEMLEEHVQQNPVQLAAFDTVCTQMLEDVQERFVYRTLIYIRQEILNYNPAQGDLAYPDKLEMMQQIAANVQKERDDKRNASFTIDGITTIENGENGDEQMEKLGQRSQTFVTIPLESSNMPMSPADLHGMWYPTVRRTLVCLSKLYRCIDRNTFQGLSQETLSMCIQSLVNAADAITKNKTNMDAQLFLIKHLLILREQIAPFHVEFAIKEMALDFSKMKGAAMELLKAKTKLFTFNSNNALLQFVLEGTPQVTETFLDSKKEVDNQLKRTCEDFIHFISDYLVGPLQDFLNKASVILQMMEEDQNNVSLRTQPFAVAEKLHDVVADTYKKLKNRKPIVQKSMSLYLSNKDTEYILFKPIKSNVQQSFQQLHMLLTDHYTEEDQQIVAAPTLEQINLLLASAVGK